MLRPRPRNRHLVLALTVLPSRAVRLACCLVAASLFFVPAARATGRDFVDEVLVASGLGGREIGLEFGSDSRIDRDYRLQGWFTTEIEAGITRAWVVEGVASFVDRGRGLEFGAWHAESRYVLLEQPRAPVSLALAAEYEVETRAAKHLSLERMLGARAIVSRNSGGLLTTFNWGQDRRLVPIRGHGTMFALGARYPEGAAITYGFEFRKQQLERTMRLGPEIRFALPRKMTLRLGGILGLRRTPYRFVGRAILETEL